MERRAYVARMRTLFVSLVLFAGCGSSAPPASTPSSDAAPTVTGAEARALVDAGAVLLDVTPSERADRSLIEGRTHIPLTELEARMGELPRDRVVVVYCLGGGASPRAGAMLRAHGYDARVMGARRNWDAAP